MHVASGQEECAVRSKPDTSAIMRARTAERMIGRRHLVRDVIDDVCPVGDSGKIIVHREPHQPVRMRVRHGGGRIDINPAVVGEIGIDRDAHHARLPFAEQIRPV